MTKVELTNELDKANDKYVRLLADFENYKRRNENVSEGARKSGAFDMFKSLEPFIKNLDFCARKSDDKVFKVLTSSLEICLKEAGFEKYGQVGDVFDSDTYNAVQLSEEGNVPVGCVSAILSYGWRYKDGTIVKYCNVFVKK